MSNSFHISGVHIWNQTKCLQYPLQMHGHFLGCPQGGVQLYIMHTSFIGSVSGGCEIFKIDTLSINWGFETLNFAIIKMHDARKKHTLVIIIVYLKNCKCCLQWRADTPFLTTLGGFLKEKICSLHLPSISAPSSISRSDR